MEALTITEQYEAVVATNDSAAIAEFVALNSEAMAEAGLVLEGTVDA